jgi:hypothetical protein
MRIDLGGPALEFVKLPDPDYSARYAAEIDGVRVPIKLHRKYTDTGYNARGSHTDDEQGMTMLLWDLDDIAGVTPTRDGDAYVFAIDIQRHYRSYKAGRVRIAYVDGVVHWDAEIDEQDDSYY